jgi:5'-phosphate synthase pdxT subunit
VRAVGVLALQGDVREHVAVLEDLGVASTLVRRPSDLVGLDALIMPGGESTAIAHLLLTSGLKDPLAESIDAGLFVLATCAGLILVASDVSDGRSDQWSYAALDVSVRRNGYGRQIASFEAVVDVVGIGELTGVFIRAPRIESVGPGVEVLATHDHGDGPHAVLVRNERIVGCSFHPELAGDNRVHKLFLEAIVSQ